MDPARYKSCHRCGRAINNLEIRFLSALDGEFYCTHCWDEENDKPYGQDDVLPVLEPTFDSVEKPEHYHKYGMDTFTFLKQGFSPPVFRGFCMGNIVKYTQRYEHKNGLEDLKKVRKYVDALIKFEESQQRVEVDPS